MPSRTIGAVIGASLLFLLAWPQPTAGAQTASATVLGNEAPSLVSGDRVRLTPLDRTPRLIGFVDSVMTDSLAWLPAPGDLSHRRTASWSSIARVDRSTSSHRHSISGMCLGIAVGAAVGLALGRDKHIQGTWLHQIDDAFPAVALSVAGAIGGEALGRAAISDQWTPVPIPHGPEPVAEAPSTGSTSPAAE